MRSMSRVLAGALVFALALTTNAQAGSKPGQKPLPKPNKPVPKPTKSSLPKPNKPVPKTIKSSLPKPTKTVVKALSKPVKTAKPGPKVKVAKTKGKAVAVAAKKRKKKPLYKFHGLHGSAAKKLHKIMEKAKSINRHRYPYLWGGGHNSSFSGPYDCSGAVSAVVHAAGFLKEPKVASEFEHFGKAGPGVVTIYACSTHVYMRICGKFFGTSSANPGGGAGWFAGDRRPGFVVRHVPLG